MKLRTALIASMALCLGVATAASAQSEPVDPPDPVEIGEDLWVAYVADGAGPWQLAEDVCPDSPTSMYQAMYNLNGWTTASQFYPGTAVLFHPSDCPPPTTTTTTSTSTTSTTSTTTTTTVAPTTTSSTVPATTTSTSTTTLPPTTTTTLPTGCPAPANTPGGSDGRGGCFPGAHNTGVPDGTTLTAYTGPCNITVANTVIDRKTITCALSIRAQGVVITRSVTGEIDITSAGSLRMEDSEIRGGRCSDCTLNGPNFTLLRVEITGGNRGAYCEHHCTITDSWVHAQNLVTGAHAGGVRQEQYTTVIHNTIACDWRGSTANDTGCSADVTGYPDFVPVHHNTFEHNLFMANTYLGFCVYGGWNPGKPFNNDPLNATYIVFRNNVFQRGTNGKCGAYGPVTSFITTRTGNVWSGNVWDNGGTVPPEE